MAPTFRSSRSGRQFTDNANRSRTNAAEHDIFEGLPIRRWARQSHTVSQDAKIDIPDNVGDNVNTNQPFPELPMPKDSHLLAPHSRALLRAARAGYIYLLPATKDTQSVDGREANETDESALASKMERSYTARKWSQIPRHVELPEVEFLAKRRAGLPSLYGASGAVTAAVPNASQSMRKAKIRKVDPATGNIIIYDAWIPEGQKVEGEIKDESQTASSRQDVTVTKANPAPGTVIEGVGVANAEGIVVASTAIESPSKRKGPPPPKRKAKGLKEKGRKKVMFAPGEGTEVGGDQMAIDGEEDEDEEDEEGEGEDAEEDEEAIKADEVKAPEEAPMQAIMSPSSEARPALDIDAKPSLPPTVNNAMPTQSPTPSESPEKPALTSVPAPQPAQTSNIEQSQSPEKPHTPVQPQPEQLTPPNMPIGEEGSIKNGQETYDEMKLDPDVGDSGSTLNTIPISSTSDRMEDIQQTQASDLSNEFAPPDVEKTETSETLQPSENAATLVQTEVKVEQITDNIDPAPLKEAPISPESIVQGPTTAPESSAEISDLAQSKPEEGPAQPTETVSEVKIEEPTPTTTTTSDVPTEPTVAAPPSDPTQALAPAQNKAESEVILQPKDETIPVSAIDTTSEPIIVPNPELGSLPATVEETVTGVETTQEIILEQQTQPASPPAETKEESPGESAAPATTSVDNEPTESSEPSLPPS